VIWLGEDENGFAEKAISITKTAVEYCCLEVGKCLEDDDFDSDRWMSKLEYEGQ
jgi:hypothetical protein